MATAPVSYGVFDCKCCCEVPTIHTNWSCSEGNMRCSGCRCTSRIPEDSQVDGQIEIRLYHTGRQTIATMRTVHEIATLLGAAETSRYVKDGAQAFYVAISTEGIQSRMEIESVRKVFRAS